MPQHDVGLYSAVVDDAARPEPVVAPLAVDTRIKVVGLSKAAQYNGQSGVVKGFDREAGRYEVALKNGKELKIKRDNMELLDGAIKGGFLSQVPASAHASVPHFPLFIPLPSVARPPPALAQRGCKLC